MIIENKKLSLGDLLCEIGALLKKYENNTTINNSVEDELYSINDIINLYPILSKHIITNAINNGDINVVWIGNKRYFKLNDIDRFLKEKQNNEEENIQSTLKSWRTK